MSWSSMWVLIALLCACTSSSGGRDDGGSSAAACEQAYYRWVEDVADVWRGLDHACVSDDDCVLVSTDLDCPEGAVISLCQRAIAEARRGEAEMALSEASTQRCAEVDPDCRAGSVCVLVEASCVEGVCASREPPP